MTTDDEISRDAELVDAQGRVASSKASYDQALAERAAALHRWVDAGGSMYRAGQITGMSAGAVRNALGLRQLPGRITRS